MFLKALLIGFAVFVTSLTSFGSEQEATPMFFCQTGNYTISIWEIVGDVAPITIQHLGDKSETGFLTKVTQGTEGARYWLFDDLSEVGGLRIALVENPENGQTWGHIDGKTQTGDAIKTIQLRCHLQ